MHEKLTIINSKRVGKQNTPCPKISGTPTDKLV